jgi:multidrug efflux pump subunit AcrA (membrane-fusion protein)
VTADAPEVDFDVINPGTKVTVHVVSTNRDLTATISRRAPSADPSTRTVHFELDVSDPEKSIPVGTTAEVRIEVGAPAPATMVPLSAATVRGNKVSVFVIEGDLAHVRIVPLKGELSGKLYLDPQLAAGARVVTEGRSLLGEGDRVAARLESAPAPPPGTGAGMPPPSPKAASAAFGGAP